MHINHKVMDLVNNYIQCYNDACIMYGQISIALKSKEDPIKIIEQSCLLKGTKMFITKEFYSR